MGPTLIRGIAPPTVLPYRGYMHPHRSGPPSFRPPRGAGRWLALAAILMALAVVLPGSVGLVTLGLAVLALLAAGVFGLRAQWRTLREESLLIAPPVDVDDPAEQASAELTARLRRLRDEHVAGVDAALDDRRPDLARALTDAYVDAALRAITESADVPARPQV
jgi:hypothetical protein